MIYPHVINPNIDVSKLNSEHLLYPQFHSAEIAPITISYVSFQVFPMSVQYYITGPGVLIYIYIIFNSIFYSIFVLSLHCPLLQPLVISGS